MHVEIIGCHFINLVYIPNIGNNNYLKIAIVCSIAFEKLLGHLPLTIDTKFLAEIVSQN
jgi:hypothetical protein